MWEVCLIDAVEGRRTTPLQPFHAESVVTRPRER
jgi:hypothetical protein